MWVEAGRFDDAGINVHIILFLVMSSLGTRFSREGRVWVGGGRREDAGVHIHKLLFLAVPSLQGR